jgi:hypothetical protein
MFLRLFIIFSLLGQSLPFLGNGHKYLYTFKDRNGKTIQVVNDLPPEYMTTRGMKYIKTIYNHLPSTKNSYDINTLALIDQIAKTYRIDPWLIRAIVQAESAFQPKAISSAGAMGLMQLMPATARRFGVMDPFEPVQNITGGVKYLRWLIDHFNNDYTKAIAAYNAGENAVKKYNGIPPYPETKAYVPRVMKLWQNKSVKPTQLPVLTKTQPLNSNHQYDSLLIKPTQPSM